MLSWSTLGALNIAKDTKLNQVLDSSMKALGGEWSHPF